MAKLPRIRTLQADMEELEARCRELWNMRGPLPVPERVRERVREVSAAPNWVGFPDVDDPAFEVAAVLAEEFGLMEMRDDDPGDPEVGPDPQISMSWPQWLNWIVYAVLRNIVEGEDSPDDMGDPDAWGPCPPDGDVKI